jgi:hypothetical protein
MEKLNSDEKMSILMNLTGGEIVRVCSTSKSMGRICNDDRYSPLWKQKILQEFNEKYTGSEKGYDRYKFLRTLYNTTFYTIRVTEHGQEDNVELYLFDKLEKAIIFTRDLLPIYTYSQIKSAFDVANFIRTEDYIYVLEEIKLTKVEEDYMKEQEKYEKEKDFIKSLYKGGRNFYFMFFKLIQDINSYIENIDREDIPDEVQEEISRIIENFIRDNDFTEHKDEVESYIRLNILIPY